MALSADKKRVVISLGTETSKKLNLECVKTSLSKSVIIQIALEQYLQKGGIVGEQKKYALLLFSPNETEPLCLTQTICLST